MTDHPFILPLRVYYEDTDAGGVVYHSNYLNFMERARTELLRELGYDQDVLNTQLGILFVVHSLQLDYLKPARFNEQLQVRTSVTKLARASVVFQQDIWRGNVHEKNSPANLETSGSHGLTNSESVAIQPEERLTSATVKVACVDAQSFKPKAIPLSIKGALNSEN